MYINNYNNPKSFSERLNRRRMMCALSLSVLVGNLFAYVKVHLRRIENKDREKKNIENKGEEEMKMGTIGENFSRK